MFEAHLEKILMKNVYYSKMGIKHVINEYEKLKSERNVLLCELNEINTTNYEEWFKAIGIILKNIVMLKQKPKMIIKE